jgi:hypothetical protein
MDKNLAKMVQEEAANALRAVAEAHGLTVRAHGGTIGGIDMVLKFQFKTADTAAIAASEKADFDLACYSYGLEPRDYGAKFTVNGKLFTVVGIDYKRRKYPIVVTDESGKRSSFTDLVVPRIVAARAANSIANAGVL